MQVSTIWENEETNAINQIEPSTNGSSNGNGNGHCGGAENKLGTLRALAARLMREAESLSEVRSVDIDEGIDFYREVTEFEIGLIKRALVHTHGHQGRAARLLNLKVTTLNSKIKQYKMSVDSIAKGYPFLEIAEEVQSHI
jgi:DNA-binding NtrC family response regulator